MAVFEMELCTEMKKNNIEHICRCNNTLRCGKNYTFICGSRIALPQVCIKILILNI